MRPEAIQLLSNAGLLGPVILVPVILQKDFGASNDVIGLIAGAFAAFGFISSYVFGRASDVHGRRRILLLGLCLSGVMTVTQAGTLVWGGFAAFSVIRVALGFCGGIFPAALLAYAYEAKSKMGKFSAWGAAGWGIGNLTVGLFGTYYEAAYLYCAAILFVSFAIALKLPFTQEVRMEVPFFPVALIRANAPVFSAMLIRHTGASMIWVTYPLFLASIGADAKWIGIIYAVNAFGQFFVMNLLDSFDPALLVTVGLGSSAATFFAFTLVGSYWQIIPAQILLATAWGCLYVGSLRYLMERNKEKSTVTGLLSSTMSLSGILGPVFGGMAATAVGFKGTIAFATVMALVALAIFVFDMMRSGELYRMRVLSRGSP